MQWDKLKTFYYVAKFQNFTKTSQHLNIAQSAISRQIIELEYQVGYQLFKRLPKGLVLTRQGEILFENTEKMFALSELALTQIQDEMQAPQGNLSLGTNVNLVETWLYEIIPGFLKLYPKINLSIFSKDKNLDVESLEVQVALQPYTEDQPELVQNFLMSWNRRLYASREYLDKFGTPKKIEDLNSHQLIEFGPEKIDLFNNINWHLKLSSHNKKVQKPYARANSLRTIFQLAKSGFGIISFSQESPLLKDSGLIQILPEIEGPIFDIYFTYPIQLQGIKKIEVLEDYLKAYVRDHHRKYISPQAP